MKEECEYSDEPTQEKSSHVQYGWYAKAHGREKRRLNIRRWLRSHVGKRFSDVNSKFVRLKKDRGACHWYDDLKHHWWVTLDCRLEDGKFYDTKDEEVIDGFVVVDDILYEVGDKKPKWKRKTIEERLWENGIVHKDNRVFLFKNNIWYELIIKHIKESGVYSFYKIDPYDYFIEGRYMNHGTRELLYGNNNWYCAGKRQLCKQEIKRLKLRTDFNSGKATRERSD